METSHLLQALGGGGAATVALLVQANPWAAPAAVGAAFVVPVALAITAGHGRRASALAAGAAAALLGCTPTSVATWVALGAAAALGWTAAQLVAERRRTAADLDTITFALASSDDPTWRAARAAADLTGARRARVVGSRGSVPDVARRRRLRRPRSLTVPLGNDTLVLTDPRRAGANRIALVERVVALVQASTTSTGGAEVEGWVDPITGLGDRRAALHALTTAEPGDAVLVVGFLDPATLGDAVQAELLACQLGLHLRSATRPGDAVGRLDESTYLVVARQAQLSGDTLARRFAGSWWLEESDHRVACAVQHVDGRAPIDLVEELTSALAAVRSTGCRAPAAAVPASTGGSLPA